MTSGTAGPRPLPGGPLALDLLNTEWRAEGQPVDWLDDDASVVDFLSSHGDSLASTDEIGPRRASLVEARDLVRRLFGAASTDGRRIDAELLGDVNGALRSARTIASNPADGLELATTSDDPDRIVAVRAVIDAAELIRDRADRIRSCQHDDCVLWFLDTSKAGRRRWCSMERCGNRAKAKRHYQRFAGPEDTDG